MRSWVKTEGSAEVSLSNNCQYREMMAFVKPLSEIPKARSIALQIIGKFCQQHDMRSGVGAKNRGLGDENLDHAREQMVQSYA
jgi:hypothetical protein